MIGNKLKKEHHILFNDRKHRNKRAVFVGSKINISYCVMPSSKYNPLSLWRERSTASMLYGG